MEEFICYNCSTKLPEKAVFCFECASQVRCKVCSETLVKNAKACMSCGALVNVISSEDKAPLNTIKFRETKEERSYEVAFTNEVGKDVSELVANMVRSNISNSHLLQEIKKKTELEIMAELHESPADIPEPTQAKPIAPIGLPDEFIIPPLNDLEMTFEGPETDWIIIYAFYISQGGVKVFTRKEVVNEYKKKRYTETRSKNFATGWKKLFNKVITTVKENEFKFKPEGVKIAVDILKGHTGKANN